GPSAQVRLGIEYRDGSERVPQDQGKALELFKEAAQAGEPRGIYHLGECYLKGIAVPQSPFITVKLFTHFLAQITPTEWRAGRECYSALKRMYSDLSSKVDPAVQRSIHDLLTASMAEGRAEAAYQLGMCSLYGWGVPTSVLRSVMLFEHSLNLDTIKDTEILGNILYELGRLFYRGGVDLSPDPQKAAQYFERGHSLGNRGATSALSVLYRIGRGVPQDTEKARRLVCRSLLSPDTSRPAELGPTLLESLYLGEFD
ncbi:MAG: hypothetical protein RL518_1725, partial [Pseudomonadota bacterium]